MLKNLLNIDGGVISVVGSGGKKTFIENLSKELKEELAIGESVLITSTMGMEIPRGLRWDEIFIPDKIFLKTAHTRKIVYYGNGIEGRRMLGIDSLEGLDNFKYVLINSDDSNGLPLKANEEFEPKVVGETDITVGVIPWGYLGRFVNGEIAQNENLFKIRFGKDAITKKTYKDIITSPEGLFKGAKGRKILLITGVYKESDDFFEFANYLKKHVDMDIIYGDQKEIRYNKL